uniref:Golgi associated, gamma adaptin ear containing, ARF binding protein 2 n=1 Tax=Strix occidentalis caurina TaxID=311401 RepID=A0A8D0KYV7_STROC
RVGSPRGRAAAGKERGRVDPLPANKATDPSTSEENWECIQRFCDQVNADTEGPSLAPRLLAHKIQSPQEMEALHALTVLETCVNNCGERFHNEIAKFRFLNELIKVLSPKYYGTWSSEKVKSRVTEVIFSWTVWFPQEVKIRDAYQMLKKQGIVKEDPKLPEDKILPPPSPRPQNSIFDTDEEKSKLLSRLLKSNHSEDLQAANRLIKSMIKEEQEKSAKVSRRVNTISEVSENVKLMDELLENYKRHELSKPDQETLQTLFQRCEKLRPLLFRLASETVDDDEALAEILQANDQLARALGHYRQVVASHDSGGGGGSAPSSAEAPGKEHPAAFRGGSAPARHLRVWFGKERASRRINVEKILIDVQVPFSALEAKCKSQAGAVCCLLCEFAGGSKSLYVCLLFAVPYPAFAVLPSEGRGIHALFLILLLSPAGSICPLTVYDRNGFKAMLHFSRDPAPGRPDVLVMVLSMLSTSAQPIKDIEFQAAVPKTMKIKLQPASGSELPAFSPLLPPAVVSQVLLLANPHKDPIRLRYKLAFTQGAQPFREVGELTRFPEAELWGRS